MKFIIFILYYIMIMQYTIIIIFSMNNYSYDEINLFKLMFAQIDRILFMIWMIFLNYFKIYFIKF